jgi:hypothetical protein
MIAEWFRMECELEPEFSGHSSLLQAVLEIQLSILARTCARRALKTINEHGNPTAFEVYLSEGVQRPSRHCTP